MGRYLQNPIDITCCLDHRPNNTHRGGFPMKRAPKNAYVRPRLVVYGKLEEITQGSSSGNILDADFPRGTEFGDLTFS